MFAVSNTENIGISKVKKCDQVLLNEYGLEDYLRTNW